MPDEGNIREALTSLYGLFKTTRDILARMSPSTNASGVTIEMLAIQMLNIEIRPFLGRWHPQLQAFERERPNEGDRAWGAAVACRSDLETLRLQLMDYAKAYAELAGVQQIERFFKLQPVP